jgi:dihydrofolate synthase/folylpolyglutamate synthase
VTSSPFTTFKAALDWLFSSTNYEQKQIVRYNTRAFNLDRAAAILEMLGNPHRSYPTVHIAGTKGKGSTSAMVTALLRAAGLAKVGLYTSPHLMNLNERIQVNFDSIPDDALFECISAAKAPVEHVTARGLHMKPTFFEIFTVISLLHFALEKVDAAVVEVGLGGRLDATNLVQPVVAGITPISFDHTSILGNTLAAIAREKAGIIKKGVPLVVGRQEAEAFAAIEEVARKGQAPVLAYGRDYLLFEGPGRRFEVQTPRRRYRYLEVPLLGRHQRQNAAMATTLFEVAAANLGLPSTQKVIRSALARFSWPGRVELFRTDPPIVIDAAHNGASARALAQAVSEAFPGRKAVVLMGIAGHKDTLGVIDALIPIAAEFVATTIDSPRSEDARALCDRIRTKTPLPVHCEADRPKALALARSLAGDDLLVITGSFYLAGELRGVLREQVTGTLRSG